MRQQLNLAILTVFSTVTMQTATAFAAQKIECAGARLDKVTIAAEQSAVGLFRANVDESLSSRYVGPVEQRVLAQIPSRNTDIIDNWDGNSGVKLVLRKGFLAARAGARSKAVLIVSYDDIAQDKVAHSLTCIVIR